ncbi:MAG: hypothetical protein C0418_05895 [Coriobacteriaceae bacterium]|nr:hypothetical protein [Coriobacteriaceae bacterium]
MRVRIPRFPRSEVRRLAPWIGLWVVLVLILPGISFVRNEAFDRGREDTTEAFGGVAAASLTYSTAVVLSLEPGAGASDEVAILNLPDEESRSTLEVAAPSRDGRYLWVVDHPYDKAPRARVRKYDRGALASEFLVPAGVTVFTPGVGGDLWAARSDALSGRETLVHYDGRGKLLATYPVPERAYVRSIFIGPDREVWILNEEWLSDPSTFEVSYAGTLLPIVEADGSPVAGIGQRAVPGGAFVGEDGLVYSLSGTAPSTQDGYPAFKVVVRDRDGVVASYSLPLGWKPFAADSAGRVYAERATGGGEVVPGVSTLGDSMDGIEPTAVFKRDELMTVIHSQRRSDAARGYPAAIPTSVGELYSTAWSDDGLLVLRRSPIEREGDSFPDEKPGSPLATLFAGHPAPLSCDPYLAGDDLERDLWHAVYSGLVSFDASLTARPDLAESIPAKGSGVSADGLTIQWTIGAGRTWHDGTPVSARDVVATWRHLSARSAVPRSEPFPGFSEIETVSAAGDDTVRVRLRRPFGAAPIAFFPYVLPAHVLEAEAVGTGAAWLTRAVGTGPYRLARWESDGRWLLEAASSEDGSPAIKVLAVEFVPLLSETEEYYRTREPAAVLWLSRDDRGLLERDRNGDVIETATGRWWGFVLNTRRPGPGRQDLRHAIIRAYPQKAMLPYALVASQETPAASPFTSVALAPADGLAVGKTAAPEVRRAMLAAGFRDTVRANPPQFTEEDLLLRVAESSRAIGRNEIEVEAFDLFVEILRSAGMAPDRSLAEQRYYSPVGAGGYLSRGGHDVGVGVFPGFIDPAWGSVFDPADSPSWSNHFGVAVTFTSDETLRRLHEEARAEYDPAKRAEFAREIAERVRELDLAFFDRPETRLTGVRGIVGYRPGPYPAGDFWNIGQWTLEEEPAR